MDLVVANAVLNGTVSILLGNGNGTFQAAVSYAAGNAPYAVVIRDFNGDGKPDLAVANYGYQNVSNVSILLGNGDGTFQPPVNYPAGDGPESLAAGDFNGDGKLDLVVANWASDNVSILLGNGDGTFQPAVSYTVGINPAAVAVRDFNGDGSLDFAVASSGSYMVSIVLGNGNGTFQPSVNYAVETNPDSIAVGDFNGDGKPDLAVGNYTSTNVSVLMNNGR
jgi:hypothetical protein